MTYSTSCTWLLALALTFSTACGGGDDNKTGADTSSDTTANKDGGKTPNPRCLATGPQAGGFDECCYTKDNAADKANAELRLVGIAFSKPTSLAAISLLVAPTIDEGRFNWLMKVDEANSKLKTGGGTLTTDGDFSAYSFYDNNADTAGGSAERWNPVELGVTYTGDDLTATTATADVVIPVAVSGTTIDLPLAAVSIDSIDFDENRNCAGTAKDTSKGALTGALTIAGTTDINVDLNNSTINLCELLAGSDCKRVDVQDFMNKPTLKCENNACADCTTDATNSEGCNAWPVAGAFAAHGVEISN